MRAPSIVISVLAPVALASLAACGVKERIHDRIEQEVAEKVVEVAAGGEIDVEANEGEVSIEGKDGSKVRVDGHDGKMVVTDAEGKTHVYEQGADGSATVTNSEGLDAEFAAKIPAGFPLGLPPLREVMGGQRVEAPDGSKVFSLQAEAQTSELDEIVAFMTEQLEAEGLKVESSTVETGDGKVVTLAGKHESAALEAGAMLTVSKSGETEHPGVMMILSWSDKRGVD